MNNNSDRILFIHERVFNPNGSINYGMAVVATIVSKKYKVKAIDNNSRYVIYSKDDILNIIKDFNPVVICFSINTLNALRSYQTIEAIKTKYKGIPIVAGGIHVSNVYKEALQYKVDFAVRGEAELVITQLIDELISGNALDEIKEDLNIQGVSYYRRREIVNGGICPLPMDLDSCSFADYSLYDLENFIKKGSGRNSFVFITQRGCPFSCTFCSNQFVNAKVRYRSIDNVITNIEYLYDIFNTDIFIIGDSNFVLSEQRVIEFCNAVIEKGLNHKIQFLVQTNSFKVIEKDVLALMKKSGFTSINFGIERLEKETQKRIKKPLKRDIIMENISNASEFGFVTQVQYLIGFPFDDEKSIERENRNFMELFHKGVDVISVNFLNPMPGTEEYESRRSTLEGWYLNPALLETYRPLYLMTKNLTFDPILINIFSFNHTVIKKMIKTKAFFRAQSIKQKSYILYLMFRVLLCISFFSEILYRNNLQTIERKLFGKLHILLFKMSRFFYFYFSAEKKDT